jgi:hypothetical protein
MATMKRRYQALLDSGHIVGGVLVVPTGTLHYDRILNDNFALCPVCDVTMAKNVCGYEVCIFGCGIHIREPREWERLTPAGIEKNEE